MTFSSRLAVIVLSCLPLTVAHCQQSPSRSAPTRPYPGAFPDPAPPLTDYQISAELVPDTIVPYQSMWLRRSLVNIGGHPALVPDIAPGGAVLRFLVFDAHHELVPVPILEGFGGAPFRNEEFEPGDSIVRYYNVDNTLWDPTRGPWSRLTPGQYSIVIFLNRGAFGDGKGQGFEPIDTLPFTVIERTEADSLAGQLYEDAWESMRGGKDMPRCIQLLREIIGRYPESALRESAYQLLFLMIGSTLAPDRRTQQTELCRNFLDELPMSPYSRNAADFLRGHVERDEFDSLMSAIRQRSPNSPVFDGRLPGERR